MNKNIQRFIDLATTKKQSHYIDPSMMNPKPIFTENGQPKTYDDFDKEKFADLIVQECINIIKTAKDGVFVSLDNAYVSAQFVNVTVRKIERIFRS